MAEATGTGNSDLTLIRFDDVEAHTRLAARIGAYPELWDERMLQKHEVEGAPSLALLYYASLYGNPANVIFDVCNDGGMFAFVKMHEGWRCALNVALWSREAHRRGAPLLRRACVAVMEAKGLHVVDAFSAVDNLRATRGLKRAGFRERGLIPNSMCYNHRIMDAAWYSIDREELGLKPIT